MATNETCVEGSIATSLNIPRHLQDAREQLGLIEMHPIESYEYLLRTLGDPIDRLNYRSDASLLIFSDAPNEEEDFPFTGLVDLAKEFSGRGPTQEMFDSELLRKSERGGEQCFVYRDFAMLISFAGKVNCAIKFRKALREVLPKISFIDVLGTHAYAAIQLLANADGSCVSITDSELIG